MYICFGNSYTHGAGGGVLAAGNVLLALLVDQVLDRDGNEDGDLEIELGALVEQAQTVRARARADQVAEDAAEHSRVDIGGVTGVGRFVTAGELSLVTALGLGLLDGHAGGHVPADAVQVLVLGAEAVGAGGLVSGHGDSHGGEAEEDSG